MPGTLLDSTAAQITQTPTSASTWSVDFIFSFLYIAIFLSVLAMILIGAINLIFPVSAQSLNNAKDKIQRAVYGGIATILLVPLINWFAPGLLNLGWLTNKDPIPYTRPSFNASTTQTQQAGASGSGSADCYGNLEFFKGEIARGKPICSFSNSSCSKVCQFSPEVRSAVISASQEKGVDYRLVLAIACRESSGDPTKVNNKLNSDGSLDCGLLQVNVRNASACPAELMDVATNARRGIDKYKSALSAVSSKTYQGITPETQALANYNCCANGDRPNDKSGDCNTQTGYPHDLPKWACPKNPGSGVFNMCKVRDYACDVSICATRY